MAQYRLGLMSEDMFERLKWLRKAAEQGKVDAQLVLGRYYRFGEGVPKDYAEATRWYRNAADQGDAGAQWALAEIHNAKGEYEESMRWYRSLSERGDFQAKWILGDMFSVGQGVEPDALEAVRLWREAADLEGTWGYYVLGCKYKDGRGIVAKDTLLAYAWFNIAAGMGGLGDEKARKEADGLERELGPHGVSLAQARSTELHKEIEARKAKK
jgi:TPR repeat protein